MNRIKEIITNNGKLKRETETILTNFINESNYSISKFETDYCNGIKKEYGITLNANVRLESVSNSHSPFYMKNSSIEFNNFNVITRSKESGLEPRPYNKEVSIVIDNSNYILQKTQIEYVNDDFSFNEIIFKQFYYEDLEKSVLINHMEPIPRYEVKITILNNGSIELNEVTRNTDNSVAVDFDMRRIHTSHYSMFTKVEDFMNIQEIIFDNYDDIVENVLDIQSILNGNTNDLSIIVESAIGFNYKFSVYRETIYHQFMNIDNNIKLHTITTVNTDNNSEYYRNNLFIYDEYYAIITGDDNVETEYELNKDSFLEIIKLLNN